MPGTRSQTLLRYAFVNWQHTRVMIMFFRALSYTFGGQGNDVSWSLGLWVDRRGGRQAAEGMGLERSLADYGFGWFADKIDWLAMVFRSR